MRLSRPRFALPASRRGRLTFGLIVGGLALILACGGYARLRHGAYAASPNAAVDRLNRAIAKQDPALFAETVDIGALAGNFARAVASGIPKTDETQVAELVQLTILAILRDEEAPRPVREATVSILPDDPRDQLVQIPFELENGPEPAVSSSIRHPDLGELPIRLGLIREGDLWRVDQVLNAPELVYRYGAHVQELQHRQREAELRRNEANKAALARLFPNPVCSGGVTRISGNVPLLSLSMSSGPTPGPETVEAWGATMTLSSADGSIVARPRVALTSKIQPGSGAAGAWSRDIDEVQYRRLDQAGPLSCSVTIDYAILTNGKIYNVAPE